MSRAHRLLLLAAATDRTFSRQSLRGKEAWVGRCIHCRGHIAVPLDPKEPGSATLEHIVPRHHGGGDELENLSLACARCNQGKGVRLDRRRRDDPTLQRVITKLLAARAERFRPLDSDS